MLPVANLPHKRWTRADCAPLDESGVWDQEKLELVDGELISKRGKTRPHVNALNALYHWLMDTVGWDRINLHAPIDVAPQDNPTNEPEPDLIVFQQHGGAVQLTQPRPDELALIVEVADTTLQLDTTVKARLYARAGIADYWVLDVNDRRMIVHRDPTPGGCTSVVAYDQSEKVTPLASPHSDLLVGDIFPS